MPHKGKLYPYAPLFWQCEAQFWPGFLPRKYVFQSVNAGSGDSWELLTGGVISEEQVPNVGIPGDCTYAYDDPLGAFHVLLYFHKVSNSPKRYSVSLRMEVPGPHAQILTQEIGPVSLNAVFQGPWFPTTVDPPFFNPGVHNNVRVRPAVWAEV